MGVNGHALILLGCRLKLPPGLEHEITHVDFSLPDTTQRGPEPPRLQFLIQPSIAKNSTCGVLRL